PERAERFPGERAFEGVLHRVESGRNPLREREVRDAGDTAEPIIDAFRVGMAGQIEHDASGQLDDAHRPEVADRAQQVLVQVAQEERTVPTLQTDLVIVDDRAEARGSTAHASVSVGRTCFGRRRYTVFGTSTLGGLRGMGFLTLA